MMKRKMWLGLMVLVLSLALVGCGANNDVPNGGSDGTVATTPGTGDTAQPVELLVSAAASMTDVLGELSASYKQVAPNVTLTFTFGASGALQTQIEEGAPVDIFMSAAQKQMKALEEGKRLVEGTKKTLLVNDVVLIVPANSDNAAITGFEALTDSKIKKIALGDPASVPVGQYSEEIFTTLKTLDAIKAKAVYGSDVRTVLTWVESGEVDCGVVYGTDAASSDKVKVVCAAPKDSHTKVTYPVAIIDGCKNVDAAQAFLDYLSTKEAKTIFEKYGFAMFE